MNTPYGFSLGKNQQTPWHNNWYNCKVAKYYQRGIGVSFLLQAAVFFHDSYLTGRLQRQQGNVKGKQMAALSSWALMGSFFVLTLQRRKAVQTSWVLCYNYTWWSIEYMFVSLKAFFLRSQVMSKVFHTKAEATTSREVPVDLFFLVLQPCLGTFHSFEKLWWSNRNERSFTLCGWLLRVLGLHPK